MWLRIENVVPTKKHLDLTRSHGCRATGPGFKPVKHVFFEPLHPHGKSFSGESVDLLSTIDRHAAKKYLRKCANRPHGFTTSSMRRRIQRTSAPNGISTVSPPGCDKRTDSGRDLSGRTGTNKGPHAGGIGMDEKTLKSLLSGNSRSINKGRHGLGLAFFHPDSMASIPSRQ